MTPKDTPHTATQGASESSERKLFEAWALKKHYAYRNKHGVWFYDFSEPLWRGFQGGRETALAQRQPAPADPQATELSMSMFATREDYGAAQAPSQEAQGSSGPLHEATSLLAASAEQWFGMTASELAAQRIEDVYENGLHAARHGVQEVSAAFFDDLPFDGCPESWAEKPFARIVWFHDQGDPSVGMQPRSGWSLADDQSGTVVGDLAVDSDRKARQQEAQAWIPVADRFPPYSEEDEFLCFSESHTFGGNEHFCTLKGSDFYEFDPDGDGEPGTPTSKCITHWMPRPWPPSLCRAAIAKGEERHE